MLNGQKRVPLLLLALAFSMLSLVGCQQLHQLFDNRPSENMPPYKPVNVQFNDQHWSADQRVWFYHTAQGTELVPYNWFLALEQPKIKVLGRVPKFADTEYLARFGFLPDAAGSQNPDGLPVGFAKDTVT